MRPSSSSTTEIEGFRIVREIARDGTAVTYDAIQVDLQRPVRLTLLALGDPRAGRFRADAWPEHPHVVSLFAAGPSARGFFIATRRVEGATTLRRRVAAGADPSSWLADVQAALTATGAVHGALNDEWALLVDRDERVLITGFGFAAPDATAADDMRALARLAHPAGGGKPARRRRRALAVGLPAAGVALLLVAVSRDGDAPRANVEAPARGAAALGSPLAAGPLRTVDCDGDAPSGRSFGCTAMQTALPGRTVVVPRAGVVVAWHVRGARGRVALRVIRPRGATTFAAVGGSGFQVVDEGPRSFRAALPVRRGDRLGLELAPGSAAGFRAAVPGATTTRFISALGIEPRAPNPAPDAGRDEELLLRVDYVPGKAVDQPQRLSGTAAAGARAGRRLDEREIVTADGDTVTAVVVALDRGVAVDVFDGTRRRARIAVPGADARGRPVTFTAKGAPDLTLAWRNPDGTAFQTRYRVAASSISALR